MKFKRIISAAAAVVCAASFMATGVFADDAAEEAAPEAAAAEEAAPEAEEAAPEAEAAESAEDADEAEEEVEDEEEEELTEEFEEEEEEEEEEDVGADSLYGNISFQDLLMISDPSQLGLSEEEFTNLVVGKLCEEYGIPLGAGTSSNWGQAIKLLTYNNSEDEPGDDYFDSSLLTPDSVVIVLYDSASAPEFILQSWSGGEGWAKVPANEENGAVPGIAMFTYDYMTAMYQSDDFSTVDAIYVGDTGNDLTVYGAYLVNADVLMTAFGLDPAMLDISADDFDIDFEEEEEEPEETAEEEVPAETEAPVEEAPAPVETPAPADSESAPVNTGNMSAGAIAGIMAAAAAAAVAVRKRK